MLFNYLLLLSFFVLSSVFAADNAEDELCSNGVKPGNSCHLVPSSGYECTSTNSTTSWCESFGGKYRCCEKAIHKCKDRSSFCRLTKHLCTSKSDFGIMKSKCEATCGFCGFKTFEEAEKTRKRIDQLARGQECDLPRKCVFPREKMLNSTRNSMINQTITTTVIDPIVAYKSRIDWNNATSSTVNYNSTVQNYNTSQDHITNMTTSTTTKAANLSTINLKTLLQSTGKTSISVIAVTVSTPKSRNARNIESKNSSDSLKTFATNSQMGITNSITLPSNFNTTVRKLTLEELKTTRDTMPKITTAEPSSLVTSLSKTVIQGTCFDEYTYCREFTSLCSHPAFSEVMASHCSLTCGRCDDVERVEEGSEDCEDMTPDCKNYRDLCGHSRYKTLMENYCPRACNHCIPMCRDRHQNCPQYFDDGFCNDTMYTYDERKYLCGATCLLC